MSVFLGKTNEEISFSPPTPPPPPPSRRRRQRMQQFRWQLKSYCLQSSPLIFLCLLSDECLHKKCVGLPVCSDKMVTHLHTFKKRAPSNQDESPGYPDEHAGKGTGRHLEIKGQAETIQIIELLNSTRILKRVLKTWDLLSLWICPWWNGYRRRKWARRHEFKSWMRLIAFHIALIPLGKVWIQLFTLQLWVNSRAD